MLWFGFDYAPGALGAGMGVQPSGRTSLPAAHVCTSFVCLSCVTILSLQEAHWWTDTFASVMPKPGFVAKKRFVNTLTFWHVAQAITGAAALIYDVVLRAIAARFPSKAARLSWAISPAVEDRATSIIAMAAVRVTRVFI